MLFIMGLRIHSIISDVTDGIAEHSGYEDKNSQRVNIISTSIFSYNFFMQLNEHSRHSSGFVLYS
jgi:hypothetical protein